MQVIFSHGKIWKFIDAEMLQSSALALALTGAAKRFSSTSLKRKKEVFGLWSL